MTICILDTSVLCELLDVPNKASQHETIVAEFELRAKRNEKFLLPIAVVIETGNHIAQNGDGQRRRRIAAKFVMLVETALDDKSPFTLTPMPSPDRIREWLTSFPDDATTGLGLADRSVIDLFNEQCERHPQRMIYIWSLDNHLRGYVRDV